MSDRATRKRLARRRVLPGYPKTVGLDTPEALAAYFATDQITCLLCGKSYRALGVHVLSIHDMTPDDYRAEFGIPWTYGLNGEDNRAAHAEHAKAMRREGKWQTSSAEHMTRLQAQGRRVRAPVLSAISRRNAEKMNVGKSGEEARRRALRSTFGSEEHRAKLRARPFANKEWFPTWWRGKHQSDEHVERRIAAMMATRRKNQPK